MIAIKDSNSRPNIIVELIRKATKVINVNWNVEILTPVLRFGNYCIDSVSSWDNCPGMKWLQRNNITLFSSCRVEISLYLGVCFDSCNWESEDWWVDFHSRPEQSWPSDNHFFDQNFININNEQQQYVKIFGNWSDLDFQILDMKMKCSCYQIQVRCWNRLKWLLAGELVPGHEPWRLPRYIFKLSPE